MVYQQSRPWDSYAEQLITNTLAIAMRPAAEIQANVRPPLTQIIANPPRFGYGSPAERTLKITDIVTGDRRYTGNDYSGRVSGYSSSSTPSLYGGISQ